MARRKASNRTRRLASKRDVAKHDKEVAERKYKRLVERSEKKCFNGNTSRGCTRVMKKRRRAYGKIDKTEKRYDKAQDRYDKARRHDLKRWR